MTLTLTSCGGGGGGGGESSSGTFNLSDKSDASSQDDEYVDDSGESNVEQGAAPDSLRGYSIHLYDNQGKGRIFYFDTSFRVYSDIAYIEYGIKYTSRLYGKVSEYSFG